MKPPLNYTTTIPVNRTVSQCLEMLMSAGAEHVLVSRSGDGPGGLLFAIGTPHGIRSFNLPVNIAGVASLLRRADYPASVKTADLARYVTQAHAARVAWRVLRDWLEAQLALVAAEMVTLDQVMLPYLEIEGETLYQRWADRAAAIEQ